MAKVNYWRKFLEKMERGKLGLNEGIPFTNFSTISNHVSGIQQGRYDLIFAPTGLGKTSFVDDVYVFGAMNYLEQFPESVHKLEIIYYSLEIPPEDKLAKYVAKKIWEDYGKLTTIKELISRGKGNKIRPEIETLVRSYDAEMDEIADKGLYFRTSLNPDYLYKDLMGYVEKRGQVIRNNEGVVLDYTPHNPALITLVVVDHIGLIDVGKYGDKKKAIDQLSKYLVFFRNNFGLSPVVISQINRSSEQIERRKDENAWHPILSDVKDSGNMTEDCNTAIGLASPFYLQVPTCLGFDINRYKDRYRLLKICKNRDGEANKLASLLFIGEYGGYYQLPNYKELEGKQPEELKRINEYYAKNKRN